MAKDVINLSEPWHNRPIFVSSTFRDMHAERDWLNQHIFPRIAEELRKRRHHLEPIDLRIGIETSNVKNVQEQELLILKVCLNEIQRSRPFLIVLLGERYGWMPKEEQLLAAAEQKGFKTEAKGKSVTALEIEFGLHRENPLQSHRCLFFFRQPLPHNQMTAAQLADYSDEFSTDPNIKAGHKRLKQLKTMIRKDPEFGPYVFDYYAKWDPSEGKVTELEEFGELVFENLLTAIDNEITVFDRHVEKTWEEQESISLAEFIEHRTRSFIGRSEILKTLKEVSLNKVRNSEHNSQSDIRGACLIGSPGSGKSAIFAQLYRSLANQSSAFLLANSSGSTLRGSAIDAMLRRWIQEMSDFLECPTPLVAQKTMSEVENIFHSLLTHVAKQKRVVMLLDALDQTEQTPRGQYLTWLKARSWPTNVRMIAMTQPGISAIELQKWPEIKIIELAPITIAEANKIGHQVWQHYHRGIDPEVLNLLVSKRSISSGKLAGGNPLWLTIALEQLNLLDGDDFSRAEHNFIGTPTERLRALLIDYVKRLPAELDELYHWHFRKVTKVFDVADVKAFLVLIALSRHGWRDQDLQALIPRVSEIFSDNLDRKEVNLLQTAIRKRQPESENLKLSNTFPVLSLASIRRSLGFTLVKRNEFQWDFAHEQARRATLTYLQLPLELELTIHRIIADYFISQKNDDPVRCDEVTYHLLHAHEYACIQVFYGSTNSTHPRELASATQTFTDAIKINGIKRFLELSHVDVKFMAIDGHTSIKIPDFHQKDLMRDIARGWCDRCEEYLLPAIESSVPLDQRRELVNILINRLMAAKKDFPNDQELQRSIRKLRQAAADLAVKGGDWAIARQQVAESSETTKSTNTQRVVSRESRSTDIRHYLQEGDLDVQRGNLESALIAYGRARHLAENDPGDALHDAAAIACDKLGDVSVAQKNFLIARVFYEKALPIFRDLALTQQKYKRDLFFCLTKLSKLEKEEKSLDLCQKYLTECLGIAENLALHNPENPEAERDLAGVCGRIGEISKIKGDTKTALQQLTRSHQILEKLVERDKSNVSWRQDLAGSFYNMATMTDADEKHINRSLTSCISILNDLESENRLNAQGRSLLFGISIHWDKLKNRDQALKIVQLAFSRVDQEVNKELLKAFCMKVLELGVKLLEEKNHVCADKVLSDLLTVAQTTFSNGAMEVLVVMNQLGIAKKRNGDLVETEFLYREVYKGVKKLDSYDAKTINAAHNNWLWVLRRLRAVDGKKMPSCSLVLNHTQMRVNRKTIYAVVIDVAGINMASGGADGRLCIWAVGQKKPRHIIMAHKQAVTGLAMSEDGSRIFSCSWDRTIKSWDVETGKILSSVRYPYDLSKITSTQDGQTVYVAGENNSVSRWNTWNNTPITSIGCHSDFVMAISATPGGQRVVAGAANGHIKLWDFSSPGSGENITLHGHEDGVWSTNISRDGHFLLSAGKDKTVLFWNLDTQEILHAYDGHDGIITATVLRNDCQLAASGSVDKTLRFWDVKKGKAISKIKFKSKIWSVTATPDMRVIVVGEASGQVNILTLDLGR